MNVAAATASPQPLHATECLSDDTIRNLIAAQVEQSDLDASAKAKLKEAVRNLPAKGLEQVVGTLTREGLARMPGAIQWLQTLVSHASS